jgi:hypothetical protein
MGIATVITLSALLIAVVIFGAFAVFMVRSARHDADVWKVQRDNLKARLSSKGREHVQFVNEQERDHARAMSALEEDYQWAVQYARAEREMRDDAIDLFMELHPDLADNFGDWAEDRHGQRDKLQGVDYEKVREYREQEELSDKFSSYVKAKRDASGKVANDARDS